MSTFGELSPENIEGWASSLIGSDLPNAQITVTQVPGGRTILAIAPPEVDAEPVSLTDEMPFDEARERVLGAAQIAAWNQLRTVMALHQKLVQAAAAQEGGRSYQQGLEDGELGRWRASIEASTRQVDDLTNDQENMRDELAQFYAVRHVLEGRDGGDYAFRVLRCRDIIEGRVKPEDAIAHPAGAGLPNGPMSDAAGTVSSHG